jgi:hypothetical protein
MLKWSCENLSGLWAKKRWAIADAGDVALVSFVDDKVEQLQVAMLGVGVVTLDEDTARWLLHLMSPVFLHLTLSSLLFLLHIRLEFVK